MATITIIDSKGSNAGQLEVADAIFAVEPNKSAVRQALLAYEANQRQGTHSTKTRGFVSGGGRKPFRQKGTGQARQGSTRSAQMRHGAIIFGPHPRSYNQKVNKKVRKLAITSALSDLRNADRVKVVKSFDFATPKTKEFKGLLGRLGLAEDQRVLVLLAANDNNVLLSARNLPNVLVTPVENVNIFTLLTCDYLVASPEAVKKLEEAIA